MTPAELTVGDFFTWEGCAEVDPTTRQSTGRLQVFMVTSVLPDGTQTMKPVSESAYRGKTVHAFSGPVKLG